MNKIQSLERTFKALANRKRLQILKHLKKHGSSFVGDIALAIRLSLHGTSKHLQILRAAGIVEDRKRGLYVTYRLPLKKNDLMKKVMGSL